MPIEFLLPSVSSSSDCNGAIPTPGLSPKQFGSDYCMLRCMTTKANNKEFLPVLVFSLGPERNHFIGSMIIKSVVHRFVHLLSMNKT
uniref:Uncharacterized protein n=1 Tax=Romanomermis culicivorax TaxID=13658 RepID=A0A915K4Y8_ROMCU